MLDESVATAQRCFTTKAKTKALAWAKKIGDR
ncbi:hypothetical protein X768_32025 [Mesorhizobium sp. LSJC265A00]|nr:hypothetical protein X768_32025 [Mesorhizobium sp. LSJC265A00]ESZ40689.1 hypothetical protein X730_30175 [Mesorhizobium sp. L103C565B0]